MKIKGSLVTSGIQNNDFTKVMRENAPLVVAINTSIILNSTAFLEGAIENLLVRRLELIFPVSEENNTIYEKAKSEIIRCSGFDGLKAHFKNLYGLTIKEILAEEIDSLIFIEHFYTIRHQLSHASQIETKIIENDDGILFYHNNSAFKKLILFLKDYYKLSKSPNVDIYKLLLISKIVDDYSKSIELVVANLETKILNKKLLLL
ncbi:MAG: hypothetical protein PF445_08600 [Melioribacteraceae bacterium]|nr:hypothetical protein [Melioribacteraceae bacterium]